MNRIELEALAPALVQSTERSRSLIDRISQQVRIDWGTGQVNILDEMAILNAFRDIRGPNSDELAQGFIAMLLDGYAVLDPGIPGETDPFGIPWRALSHGPTLAAITTENWDAFGIRPWSNTNSIRQELNRKFPQVPAYVLQDDHIDALADWAARRAWLDRLNQVMMGPGPGAGPDPKPDPGDTPAPPRGADPPKIDTGFVKPLVDLIRVAAECLTHGQWSMETGAFGFPIGPKVCLDRACADRLENALYTEAAAAGLEALVAALAPAPSVVKTIGGWGGLGLAHFSLHWAILITVNKTANGVCLIHFLPWFSPAFSGILNGYAVGL